MDILSVSKQASRNFHGLFSFDIITSEISLVILLCIRNAMINRNKYIFLRAFDVGNFHGYFEGPLNMTLEIFMVVLQIAKVQRLPAFLCSIS